MKNKVLHAVIWIFIYVLIVNLGDFLSETLNLPYMTALCVLLLSLLLGVYILVTKTKLTNRPKDTKVNIHPMILYLPLIIIGLIQLVKGIDQTIDQSSLITIIVLMLCVGFIEEVIFRGLLLRGIQQKASIKRAIIISGVTFGIGHIVNLSRGYGYNELIAQIIVAIAIGIMLSMIVVLTNQLLPGILFHMVFNIMGSITIANATIEFYILIVILLIAIPVSIYLYKQIKQMSCLDQALVTMNRIEHTQ
jgi:hypothetical protein